MYNQATARPASIGRMNKTPMSRPASISTMRGNAAAGQSQGLDEKRRRMPRAIAQAARARSVNANTPAQCLE